MARMESQGGLKSYLESADQLPEFFRKGSKTTGATTDCPDLAFADSPMTFTLSWHVGLLHCGTGDGTGLFSILHNPENDGVHLLGSGHHTISPLR